MITKFGKTVVLKIYEKGVLMLNTSGLRVDFDVRMLQGFNRAKFDIFNLAPETISQLSAGDKHVTLEVSLHGGTTEVLIDQMYINNLVTEKKVPNTITSLYCIDSLRRDFTSKEINLQVLKPSLKNIQQELSRVKLGGVEFINKDFPPELENYVPPRGELVFTGSMQDFLKKLSKQYNCTAHIKGNTIEVCHLPQGRNAHLGGQGSRETVLLDTSNMRANPVIGAAQLQIESNLDLRIEGNTLLDTSNLVTATTEDGFELLTISKDYLQSMVSGYSRYCVLSVQHQGSTHTNLWTTKALAIKASNGLRVADYNWFGEGG